jgi:hypothetical protein
MRVPVLIATVILLVACAHVAPTPGVPPVTSAEGRQCVQTCQALYNQCASGANSEIMVGGNYWGYAGRQRVR